MSPTGASSAQPLSRRPATPAFTVGTARSGARDKAIHSGTSGMIATAPVETTARVNLCSWACAEPRRVIPCKTIHAGRGPRAAAGRTIRAGTLVPPRSSWTTSSTHGSCPLNQARAYLAVRKDPCDMDPKLPAARDAWKRNA
jgi:hypothetical protein